MAKKLSKFTFRKNGTQSAKYPWDQWLDGSYWCLKQGVDFTIERINFKACAWAAAHRIRKLIRTELVGETDIVIRAYDSEKQRDREGQDEAA